jgi:hypothetical protein
MKAPRSAQHALHLPPKPAQPLQLHSLCKHPTDPMPGDIFIYLFEKPVLTLVMAEQQLGGLQLERQINCVSSLTAGRFFACKVVKAVLERC